MASSWLKKKLKSKPRRSRITPKDHRFVPILEHLSDRTLLSVTASFAELLDAGEERIPHEAETR
jgi:hypothetical protein